MESKPKKDLIRISSYEGLVKLDLTGKAKGRGVYLCPNKECLEMAKKKRGLNRSLQMDISKDQLEELFEALEKYETKTI